MSDNNRIDRLAGHVNEFLDRRAALAQADGDPGISLRSEVMDYLDLHTAEPQWKLQEMTDALLSIVKRHPGEL